LDKLNGYSAVQLDENTFEVELNKKEKLNDFIADLSKVGMVVTDCVPRGIGWRVVPENIKTIKSEVKSFNS